MKWIGGLLAGAALAALVYFENKKPLRREIEPALPHDARNLAIAALSSVVVNFLEKPINDELTKFVDKKNFGLVKFTNFPTAVQDALAVILLDYTLYLWHVATHRINFLWNFHKIHHADLDLKATTAVRFHFAEMTVSIPWRAAQILFIGVSPRALKIWQNALFINIFFHHSNLHLPSGVENFLQNFVATPVLHGIHHSDKKAERDSNWTSGLTVWDRLHGTFLAGIPPENIGIGIENFGSISEVSLKNMLAEPFLVNEPDNPPNRPSD